MEQQTGVSVKGHIKIHDPNTGEVLVDKDNAINFETMSMALAYSLADRGYGMIAEMSFGNGAASIDSTGIITYLPPNVTGTNASLYNQTFSQVVDDKLTTNVNPLNNKMTVTHIAGKLYTDILVSCLLDYVLVDKDTGIPVTQETFDNDTNLASDYTFNELGLKAYDTSGVALMLISHVVFHPVQKSLNRQIQIDYTIRIQALTNLMSV